MLAWVQSEMRRFPAPWFVAGGWALDLFAGEVSRPHADVDIAILRADQAHLHSSLSGWSFAKAVNGELNEWQPSEYLASPTHEIHGHHNDLRLEFLLNEHHEVSWEFRRNPTVTLSLHLIGAASETGVPYLAPEIVLLFKAKSPRATDENDFLRTLPILSLPGREWLAGALAVCHPRHPWQAVLQSVRVA